MKPILHVAVTLLFLPITSAQTTSPYDQLISTVRTLVQGQKLDDAAQLCETAAHLDPSRWEAYGLEGSILALQKRYKEAVPLLQKALDKAPPDRTIALQQALDQSRHAAESSATPSTGAASGPSPPPTQAEIVLWKTIENGNNIEDFKAYLRQYPKGTFAVLATNHLAKLEGEERLRLQSENEQRTKDEAAAKEAAAKDVAAEREADRVGGYQVKMSTTKGDIVVQVHPYWAPLGAQRFKDLVERGFYNNSSIYRVVPNFVAQFGISVRPISSFSDDPVKRSNKRGTVAFASSGPNTRTTEVFINLTDNPSVTLRIFLPLKKSLFSD